MLKKRGQGLSINTIIVAVIGLIILTVIILILTDKLGGFGEGVAEASSCEKLCEAAGATFSARGTIDLGVKDSSGDCKCNPNP